MLTDFYEQGSIFSFYIGRSFTLVNNEAAADLTTEKLWQLFFFFLLRQQMELLGEDLTDISLE